MPYYHRRQWLQASSIAVAGCLGHDLLMGNRSRHPVSLPAIGTDAEVFERRYTSALEGLQKNLRQVLGFPEPVLIEGGAYPGIWLECGPTEGLVYSSFNRKAARANHEVFFSHQREDGYLPCWIWFQEKGTGQIQMVVPIAATACELFEESQDTRFLEMAYRACARWDDWLVRYRDTRKTGLCEAFCEYDTGHDNSPRWKGLPKACPDKDARICPQVGTLPYLAPDLSATVYGGRIALARMAGHLGRKSEESRWLEKADRIRQAILRHCFDDQDGFFYDRDKNDRFIRIRGDVITRVCGEHVPDQKLFDQIFHRHLHNPKSFWTPYPFPSIAADDPAFVHELPNNSWGGASQALTALRAPRWMEHYGKYVDLQHLMAQWVKGLVASTGFMQQMNPWTGHFSTSDGYSPAMLVLVDFTARLYGVHKNREFLDWTCRMPEQAKRMHYRLPTVHGEAFLAQESNIAHLRLDGKELLTVHGLVRIQTDLQGRPLRLIGIDKKPTGIRLLTPDRKEWSIMIAPDQISPIPDLTAFAEGKS